MYEHSSKFCDSYCHEYPLKVTILCHSHLSRDRSAAQSHDPVSFSFQCFPLQNTSRPKTKLYNCTNTQTIICTNTYVHMYIQVRLGYIYICMYIKICEHEMCRRCVFNFIYLSSSLYVGLVICHKIVGYPIWVPVLNTWRDCYISDIADCRRLRRYFP